MSRLIHALHLDKDMNDVLWDIKFAASQDVLEQLADVGHQEYLLGQTEDFDPDETFEGE
ncbi:MAG: hypothetical protein H0X30_12255 [Anaerolineae bacterium]|nr:hypothetical protein [Anaerolineae bacterium]